ncbi:MAG: PH domain-containing protein [Micromonosporaceae bacterium]|nr:PH domain-containing protein [Micromonosporaceae bacterium]
MKFRYNTALPIAGLVALLGATPVAATRWYLAPLLLIPLAVTLWGIWAGTDAGPAGVTVRALLGRRRWSWEQIDGFLPVGRRVYARLSTGAMAPLPAVTTRDLPRLVSASGHDLSPEPAQ